MADQVAEKRWNRGDQIFWNYVNPMFPDGLDQRPVTVIADDEDHLAVWLAPGTQMLSQVSVSGLDIRSHEGAKRFTEPRAQARRTWSGAGIVAGSDRRFAYKDEDEFEFAQEAGLISEREAEEVRQAGVIAEKLIKSWSFPFGSGYEDFEPDPRWPIPELPMDAVWDVDLVVH